MVAAAGKRQVPRLRRMIRYTNHPAPLGMTGGSARLGAVLSKRHRFKTIVFCWLPNRATIAKSSVDLKRVITTFTYRIEAKPDGGFIAHASDPNVPLLEAPTREELQQKIQTTIAAAVAEQFPGLKLPAEGQPFKFDFHIKAKPGGGFSLHSHNRDPNAAAIEGATHADIELPFAEKIAGVLGKYFFLLSALRARARGR